MLVDTDLQLLEQLLHDSLRNLRRLVQRAPLHLCGCGLDRAGHVGFGADSALSQALKLIDEIADIGEIGALDGRQHLAKLPPVQMAVGLVAVARFAKRGNAVRDMLPEQRHILWRSGDRPVMLHVHGTAQSVAHVVLARSPELQQQFQALQFAVESCSHERRPAGDVFLTEIAVARLQEHSEAPD